MRNMVLPCVTFFHESARHLNARRQLDSLRHPPLVVVDAQLAAPVDDGSHVVRVTLSHHVTAMRGEARRAVSPSLIYRAGCTAHTQRQNTRINSHVQKYALKSGWTNKRQRRSRF